MSLKDINGCILIPTYNNQKTLKRVIDGVLGYASDTEVIIINDGSTDSTRDILKAYEGRVHILHNEVNSGKGFSLRRGFKEAIRLGFANAITIDSDGQHYPDDIPVFIEAAKQHPGALLMGARDMEQEGVPKTSSFGNKFSNFWYQVETGIKLPDTQTGYRLYPLEPLKKIRLFTTKFETEIEVIVKLAWKDVEVLPVKVKVLYDPDERVSHFRPFKDFTRISLLNTWLFTLTLLWHLPRRVVKKIFKKGLLTIIKEEAIKPDESNFMKALSVGFGFFMGIVPIWGLQLLIGIPLSIIFRMNKVLFVAAANISIPPMIPIIIFVSYFFGGFFVNNDADIPALSEITLETIHMNFVQYAVGAVVFALIAGLVSFGISLGLFRLFRRRHAAQAAD